MALTSTIFVFEIDLADSDRGVFESLSLRVARHPSESDEFLAARVLAYCLEYAEETRNKRAMREARRQIQRAEDIRWSYVSDLQRIAK